MKSECVLGFIVLKLSFSKEAKSFFKTRPSPAGTSFARKRGPKVLSAGPWTHLQNETSCLQEVLKKDFASFEKESFKTINPKSFVAL
jgi:hypothetical protein